MGRNVPEQVESGGIDPLQVVQKKHKRTFVLCEGAEKPPYYRLETAVCIQRREFLYRLLLSYDEFDLRNEVHNKLGVLPQRFLQDFSPAAQLIVAASRGSAPQDFTGIALSVAYGMSRLYWSNLPDANKLRCATSIFCNSFTTDDFPTPE